MTPIERYVELWIDLCDTNLGSSWKAEELRAEMDKLWYELTGEELELLGERLRSLHHENRR